MDPLAALTFYAVADVRRGVVVGVCPMCLHLRAGDPREATAHHEPGARAVFLQLEGHGRQARLTPAPLKVASDRADHANGREAR